MPRTSRLFPKLGFEVWQVPGVSRAWRCELPDGSFLLVTDVGGYDLPDPGGPYSAIGLTRANDLIELESILPATKDLCRWLGHMKRLAAFRAASSAGAMSLPQYSPHEHDSHASEL